MKLNGENYVKFFIDSSFFFSNRLLIKPNNWVIILLQFCLDYLFLWTQNMFLRVSVVQSHPKGQWWSRAKCGRAAATSFYWFLYSVRELLCSVERGLAVKHTKLPAAFQPRVESCYLALERPKPPRQQIRVESAFFILSLALQDRDVSANRDFGQCAGSRPGQWGTFCISHGCGVGVQTLIPFQQQSWATSFLPTPVSLVTLLLLCFALCSWER